MNNENRTKLSFAELLEMFKHLDTRVAHQELLYIPLAAAFIPATLASWDKIQNNPLIVLAGAIGSILIYLYHLFSIRRFAVFQHLIFKAIHKLHRADFYEIMHNNMGKIGVQRLRVVGLPLLGALWAMILLKADFPGWKPHLIYLTIGSVVLIPTAFSIWLFLEMEKET